jgi:hypothetical protein
MQFPNLNLQRVGDRWPYVLFFVGIGGLVTLLATDWEAVQLGAWVNGIRTSPQPAPVVSDWEPTTVTASFGPPPRPGDSSAKRVPHLGTWRRTSEPAKITLHFDQQSVSGLYHAHVEGADLQVSFVGDYRLGRGNLIYGVIQEAGVRASSVPAPGHEASSLIDQPFSVRLDVDESKLTIHDLKFAGVGLPAFYEGFEEIVEQFLGQYIRLAQSES